MAGSLVVDDEIPFSLEIGVSKNTPHNSLEHFEKLPKSIENSPNLSPRL